MQSQRAAAVCAAIALMTGGLAACGDDEPTEPTSTASPISVDKSTSSTSSSSPASETSTSAGGEDLPKDLPAAARKETKEGAAAFGKYYYLAFGDATHSGDTSQIELLDSGECLVCSDGVKNIQADAKKGWTRSLNPYTVTDVKATKRPDKGYKVTMKVDVKGHSRVDSEGKKNASVRAAKYTLTEHLVWEQGRWQVLDWIAT